MIHFFRAVPSILRPALPKRSVWMAWHRMDFGNWFILPEQLFPFRAGCFEESLSTCKLKFPEPRAKVIRAYMELSREGIKDLL